MLQTFIRNLMSRNFNGYVRIDPDPTTTVLGYDINFDAGSLSLITLP